jgi:DNA-binding beta-propeller fold protein YncE
MVRTLLFLLAIVSTLDTLAQENHENVPSVLQTPFADQQTQQMASIERTARQGKYNIPSNPSPIRNIRVPRNPEQVIIAPGDTVAFVRSFIGNTISVISIPEAKVTDLIAVPSQIHMSLSDDGKQIIVASITELPLDSSAHPTDEEQFIFISPTDQSILTVIDVGAKRIQKQIFFPVRSMGLVRKTYTSTDNDLIYVRLDYGVIAINLKDSTITKAWPLNYQTWYAEMDRKNNTLFITDISDSLRAIHLSSEQTLSVPLYMGGSYAGSQYIAVDTLLNRVFVQGILQGASSDVLVFDAVSLEHDTTIKTNFGLRAFLPLSSAASLYLGGFGGETIELNYFTLALKKTLISSRNWKSIIHNRRTSTLYTYQVGADEGGQWSSSLAQYLDVTEYDINRNRLLSYPTTDSQYKASYGRGIALTSDGNYIMATNSPENTVSILQVSQPTAITQRDFKTGNPIYSLHQNYPNPFNPSTTIEFSLPRSSYVSLKVFGLLGEEVATLEARGFTAGSYKVDWNAKGVASGVYLYRLVAGSYAETRKMLLLR